MSAYYNEHDPFAAAWLRELIAYGLIAAGEVDERSIEDVRPSDLAGFVQCHFFAGIGIWSLALRQAGWPDDQPIWTGSCPCQPFSAAGKGGGFADERHLWPAFHWLIEQSRPQLVLGEQVASKDGLAWLDLVSADVEASGYAFGAADTCAAGFGAPHIRQRLYWMADALPAGRAEGRTIAGHRPIAGSDEPIRLADASCGGQSWQSGSGGAQDERAAERGVHGGLANTYGGNSRAERQQRSGEQRQQPQDGGAGGLADSLRGGTGHAPGQGVGAQAAPDGSDGDISRERLRLGIEGQSGGVELASGVGRERREATAQGHHHDGPASERSQGEHGAGLASTHRLPERPGPLNGLWRDADWLCCTDGKWRPVAPGTFPLAPAGTVRNRVGTLRGAGNAINLAQAQAFVEAVIEVRGCVPMERAA